MPPQTKGYVKNGNNMTVGDVSCMFTSFDLSLDEHTTSEYDPEVHQVDNNTTTLSFDKVLAQCGIL